MVKDKNTRLMVTFSKAQAEWIRTNAKKLGMTTSRFIKFLIDKNIGKFLSVLPAEKFDEIVRICKTPWLDFDNEYFD